MEFIIAVSAALVGLGIFLFGVYCGTKLVFHGIAVEKIEEKDKYSKYRDKKTGLLTPYKINSKVGEK